MKKLLLWLLLSATAVAQYPFPAGQPYQLLKSSTCTASAVCTPNASNGSGTATGGFPTTEGIGFYRVSWTVDGTVSACAVSIDSQSNALAAWSVGGIATSGAIGSCATAGSFTTPTAIYVNAARITPVITGTGNVTFTIIGGLLASSVSGSGGGAGTITSVVAGTGLTGGGASGAVTLTLGQVGVANINSGTGATSGTFLRGDLTWTNTLAAAFNTSVGYQINGVALASTHLSDTAALAYLANAQSFTAQQTFPLGTGCSTGSFNFVGMASNTFIYGPTTTSFGICISNIITHVFNPSGFINVGQVGGYCFGASNAGSAKDTCWTKAAPGFLAAGTGASGNLGTMIQGANTLTVITANFTTASASLVTITGLSKTLPSVAANWSFDCHLIFSEATASTAIVFGVQTATNASTNLAAWGRGDLTTTTFTDTTPITGVSSTTAQNVLSLTPTATANTVLTADLHGALEGVSASGTTLNIMVDIASGIVVTVYRGSQCYIH